ncbi:hypothetical protein L798_14055 [Zootermopsis nevadensis]|uniref:Uncharacterized protein n=1 Tax=Zootermopsis nevadensis TaxID=136037 RepID=A0A067R2F5_ZOONE|nr:hypothetical protein L798_14055 [Zootermopsis nevadensis]
MTVLRLTSVYKAYTAGIDAMEILGFVVEVRLPFAIPYTLHFCLWGCVKDFVCQEKWRTRNECYGALVLSNGDSLRKAILAVLKPDRLCMANAGRRFHQATEEHKLCHSACLNVIRKPRLCR